MSNLQQQPLTTSGGISIPTVFEIPALLGTPAAPIGPPVGIGAAGGSILNQGAVSCFFSTTPNPLDGNAVELLPAGSIPWPDNLPCWAWTEPGSGLTGSVVVLPIQLPYSPGAIAGASVILTGDYLINPVVPLTNQADESALIITPYPIITFFAGTVANGQVILNPPAAGEAYYITKVQAWATAEDLMSLNCGPCQIWCPVGAKTPGVMQIGEANYVDGPARVTTQMQYGAFSVNQNCTIVVQGYTGP